MKTFIGIDVSSQKLNIHVSGKQKSDSEIPNSEPALLSFIRTYNLEPNSSIVGLESTGRYHLLAKRVFLAEGFQLRLINPILTNKKISTSIRKKKTDISDAKIIADLLAQGKGHLQEFQANQEEQKVLLRTRKNLVVQRSSVKLLLKDLTKAYPSPSLDLIRESLDALIITMDQHIQLLEDQVFTLSSSKEIQLIQSIPGFAKLLSTTIVSEVGDFSRFPSARQFKAFVGIDPKVNQSGKSLRTGKITKRGSPMLRHAFYLAAQVSRRCDPEIKQFFDKKISEGKPFRVAMVATSRKLCERVFAVVERGTPYVVHQFSS